MSDLEFEAENLYDERDSVEPLVNPKNRRPMRKNRFKRKRKLVKCLIITFVVMLALGVTCLLVYLVRSTDRFDHHDNHNQNLHNIDDQQRRTPKKILIWSKREDWKGPEPFQLKIDSEYPCIFESYTNTLFGAFYDGIVINAGSNSTVDLPSILIDHRANNLVYALQEPSKNGAEFPLSNRYNYSYTMTYRTDSDVIWNRYAIRDRHNEYRAPQSNVSPLTYPPIRSGFHSAVSLKNRAEKRDILGLVAVCKDSHMGIQFYEELRKYVDQSALAIDYSCDPDLVSNELKSDKYKFLFAIENPLCTDNLSKFFYIALRANVVPVVLGGPIDYKNFAPEHSYIRADTFNSMRELAEYLMRLDEVPSEYIEYIWWSEFFHIQSEESPLQNLCELIHRRSDPADENRNFKKFIDPSWWNHIQCSSNITVMSN